MSLKTAQGDIIPLGIESREQKFAEREICDDKLMLLTMLFGIAAPGFSAHLPCSGQCCADMTDVPQRRSMPNTPFVQRERLICGCIEKSSVIN